MVSEQFMWTTSNLSNSCEHGIKDCNEKNLDIVNAMDLVKLSEKKLQTLKNDG